MWRVTSSGAAVRALVEALFLRQLAVGHIVDRGGRIETARGEDREPGRRAVATCARVVRGLDERTLAECQPRVVLQHRQEAREARKRCDRRRTPACRRGEIVQRAVAVVVVVRDERGVGDERGDVADQHVGAGHRRTARSTAVRRADPRRHGGLDTRRHEAERIATARRDDEPLVAVLRALDARRLRQPLCMPHTSAMLSFGIGSPGGTTGARSPSIWTEIVVSGGTSPEKPCRSPHPTGNRQQATGNRQRIACCRLPVACCLLITGSTRPPHQPSIPRADARRTRPRSGPR